MARIGFLHVARVAGSRGQREGQHHSEAAAEVQVGDSESVEEGRSDGMGGKESVDQRTFWC